MKQAYQAANPVDAQLVVDLLASEGIAAFIQQRFEATARSNLQRSVTRLRPWLGFW